MGGIGKILTGSPTVVTPATTVLQAVEVMSKARTGACVVIDGGELKGLFTERDLMSKVVLKQLDPAKVSIGEVCTTALITASPETPEHPRRCARWSTGISATCRSSTRRAR